ncbi:ADP-ribosylglycohydrolase family protein [Tessaracoccus sp. OH4464_COT-324]|uniref:ADP-ribosylglycohydrolase family protein n=1 Tax=Tessaracoccus sp. OH4464_COT-324 TaxID=2491059 RepID=UPI000F641BF9|nr:ADP-ribosylglycohydrolase family protein [Tessaracoccus sp. OH4464_COT-324]RRD47327.1 ADP-ribosylglycohydrolase family protein [Tessaracoccus sp. OH4464_COT-324]
MSIAAAITYAAVADALGGAYEGMRPFQTTPQMIDGGFGNRKAYYWTDDTAMSVPIIVAISAGLDLRTSEGEQYVVDGWSAWFDSNPTDIGIQTRKLLAGVETRTPDALAAAALDHFQQFPNGSAGNGALMRSYPVGLAGLDDADTYRVAYRLASLTHGDPMSSALSALWAVAVRRALAGELNIRAGLHLVEDALRERVEALIREAESTDASVFARRNGWVEHAFAQAWAAIRRGDAPLDTVNAIIQMGFDTDTVATIAASLLGARYGDADLPEDWKQQVKGWPGMLLPELVAPFVQDPQRKS